MNLSATDDSSGAARSASRRPTAIIWKFGDPMPSGSILQEKHVSACHELSLIPLPNRHDQE